MAETRMAFTLKGPETRTPLLLTFGQSLTISSHDHAEHP